MAGQERKSTILTDCLNQAQNLTNLIEYAKDSVVSKTILSKSVGSITLFAFDRGQSLSEHTSPYDAVVQVLDGTARLAIGGQDQMVCAGQLIIMPANVPHAVIAEEKFKMLLIMIRA
ncbi:MAG TPA: cupin domain-containing protein [Sedimentisphaerales bacterium]|jgi:quercetin dioxygenase-like cupin family protein|nr:cupin domain-containing protein [Sedimentisphaerales bacterium]